MKTVLSFMAGISLLATTAAASPASFVDYCQNSAKSKQEKFTLELIAEMADSKDCAKMESYIKDTKYVRIHDDNLADLTALSFFDHFKSFSLLSTKALDLTKAGQHPALESLSIEAPIKQLPYVGANVTDIDIGNAPNVDLSVLPRYAKLASLTIFNSPLTTFSEINKLSQLIRLRIEWSNITAISQISNLTKLERLELTRNGIDSLEGIEAMTDLFVLNLAGNHITDINPLSKLPRLYTVNLSFNPIKDLSPLESHNVLSHLELDGMGIDDLSFIPKLGKLGSLSLKKNAITNIAPLAKMTSLEELDLSHNYISDLSPLNSLNLRYLEANDNAVTALPKVGKRMRELNLDGNLIASLEGLQAEDNNDLERLSLRRNLLKNLKGIGSLDNLQSLHLTANRLETFEGAEELNWLKAIFATRNRIYDVSALSGLVQLEALHIDDNEVRSIAPLKDSPIKRLTVDDNPLGHEVKRYESNCPTKAESQGVAKWCLRPIKRTRLGSFIVVGPQEDGAKQRR